MKHTKEYKVRYSAHSNTVRTVEQMESKAHELHSNKAFKETVTAQN